MLGEEEQEEEKKWNEKTQANLLLSDGSHQFTCCWGREEVQEDEEERKKQATNKNPAPVWTGLLSFSLMDLKNHLSVYTRVARKFYSNKLDVSLLVHITERAKQVTKLLKMKDDYN